MAIPKSDLPDRRGVMQVLPPAEIGETVLDRIRRVSLGGRYYGECSGAILTVLLQPEPCDALWQRHADPVQPLRIRPPSPLSETLG